MLSPSLSLLASVNPLSTLKSQRYFLLFGRKISPLHQRPSGEIRCSSLTLKEEVNLTLFNDFTFWTCAIILHVLFFSMVRFKFVRAPLFMSEK